MAKPSRTRMLKAVHQIAQVASMMFDGELCGQIVTERSWKWMRDFDPDDRWSAMDNYDVEHAPFVAAKRTLLRLERLAPDGIRVGCSLWQPVPTLAERATCVIQNGGPARWQKFGDNDHPLTAEMQAALAGQIAETPDDGGDLVTVLAPVRDSFKQVVGFIEVSAAPADPAIQW